jgi:conjugative relaxase-like TrwC/TraI family protein
VLRINEIANSAACKAYFSVADYMIDGQELEAYWHGQAAPMLSLSGRVEKRAFDYLCDNLHPVRGQKLTAAKGERRVGYDFTFSVPKSVSVLHAVGGDGRIADAFRVAVAATMGEVEREMKTRVRKRRADFDRPTGNMVWCDFVHNTSRPIGGYPDPQLHIHAVAFSLTWDDQEGQWKAGQFGDLKKDGPYFQAVFRSRLAAELQGLGYELKAKAGDFEVVGIPARVREEFSRRTAQIDNLADQLGITRPETKAKLGATSREAKKEGQSWESLLVHWAGRLTNDELRAVRDTVEGADLPLAREDRSAEALTYAVSHLTERRSVVDQREVMTEALRFDPTAVSPEAVARELSRPGLIRREQGERTVITTKGVLAEEKALLDFAREGRGRFVPLGIGRVPDATPAMRQQDPRDYWVRGAPVSVSAFHADATKPDTITLSPSPQAADSVVVDRNQNTKPVVSQNSPKPEHNAPGAPPDHFVGADKMIVLSSSPQGNHVPDARKMVLSPSQQLAARHALTSPDRLIVVRGVAGSGKSTMLRAVMPHVRDPWVILAPSVTASRGELRESGFDHAETLAKFLGSKEMQDSVRSGLIVLDEAGMAGMKDVARLTKLADQLNARILLLGDRRQHKSPVRGDVLSLLEDKGIPVIEVAEIKRQAGEYRKAVEALAAGNVAKGFDRLDALGWVKDHSEGHLELVDDYLTALAEGKSALVISPTHAAGDQLNAAIRDRLRADGKLGEDRQFKQLVPLHYTEAQLREARKHPEPDVLLTRFGAYRQDTLALAPGDRIRTTAGVKDVSGKRIDNGTMLTVSGFTDDGIKVRTVSGAERILPEGVGHLAHGYVSTSHASQGRTVDVVLVDMTSQNLPAVSASQLYVSASRGRQKAVLYVDDRDATRQAIHKQDDRPHAVDLVRIRAKKVRSRLRKHLARLREGLSIARDAVMGKQQEVSLERA